MLRVERHGASGARLSVLLMLVLVCVGSAQAFGWRAHALIAARAQTELTPQTARVVKRLLASIGAHSMVEVASWADRNNDDITKRWHYINYPRNDCHYKRQRDCPDGNCLVEAIKTQQAILADHGKSGIERGKALRYLIHFVGDAHQPLHSGRYSDRGGNRYQINIKGEGSNLHRLWDTDLADYLPTLRKDVLDAPPLGLKLAGPVAWTEASCRLVNSKGFYPSHKPSKQYLHRAARIYEHQIEAAGDRLAMLLNQTLGADPTATPLSRSSEHPATTPDVGKQRQKTSGQARR